MWCCSFYLGPLVILGYFDGECLPLDKEYLHGEVHEVEMTRVDQDRGDFVWFVYMWEVLVVIRSDGEC